jgi:hypothetical protein
MYFSKGALQYIPQKEEFRGVQEIYKIRSFYGESRRESGCLVNSYALLQQKLENCCIPAYYT